MSAAEKLVEAHVQDCGLELFQQYRITLKPSPAPPLAVAGRNTRLAQKAAQKAPQETDDDLAWSQFWIVALYVGIDAAYGHLDLQTWAAELDAPLILNVHTTKFRQLNTREQQVALILRVREAWGVEFYRTLRKTPILLPRIPAHGFLTQLAKLAETQSLADFSARFPSWLVSRIRVSNTPAAGLALLERGEREVGRADIVDYLEHVTAIRASRDATLHHCPRITFNEGNRKRRRTARKSPSLQSPQTVEQRRGHPAIGSEQALEDVEEALANSGDSPPYSPTHTLTRTPLGGGNREIGEDLDGRADEEFDISGMNLERASSDVESAMTHTNAAPRGDPLSAAAVKSAGAVTLQDRVRARHTAFNALATATINLSAASLQLSSVTTRILSLLGLTSPCDDLSALLSDALTNDTTHLAKLRSTHAAVQTLRAALKDSGVDQNDSHLELWGLGPGLFQDTPEYNEQVDASEVRIADLKRFKELYKDAVFDVFAANEGLQTAEGRTRDADADWATFVRTIVAIGAVHDLDTLEGVLGLI